MPRCDTRSVEDVRKYIEARIPSVRRDLCVSLFSDVFHKFLLAKLHMDSLLVSLSRLQAVRNALEKLPGATYNKAMERIKGIDVDKKLLSWITYARRQLSIMLLSLRDDRRGH